MKTSERFVTAEVEIDGKVRRKRLSIATKGGELMTHRLKRLMAGCVKYPTSGRGEDAAEMHFLGIVWQPPYTLLQEIVQNRAERQMQLYELTEALKLYDASLDGLLTEVVPPIPEKADNTKITTLIQHEMDLRHQLKLKINELERGQKSTQNSAPMPRPYEVT